MINQFRLLSPEDWDQWAALPQTQQFRQKLANAVEEKKEDWARQSYTAEADAVTLRLNVAALAAVEVLREVVEIIDECKLPGVSNE